MQIIIEQKLHQDKNVQDTESEGVTDRGIRQETVSTEQHLHLASSWMSEHYLPLLLLFTQECAFKIEALLLPRSLSLHISSCVTLSVSLLLLLSQGQRWTLTSQGQVFAYKESAFPLCMSFAFLWPQLMIHEWDISAGLKAIGLQPTAAQCVTPRWH